MYWVENLIKKKLDTDYFQVPGITIDQGYNIIKQKVNSGEIIMFTDRVHNIIHLMGPRSYWVWEYDIIADCPNVKIFEQACRDAQTWFWEQYPDVQKLEILTHRKSVTRMAEILGWEKEGIRKKSFKQDDKWVDEYLYGLHRPGI